MLFIDKEMFANRKRAGIQHGSIDAGAIFTETGNRFKNAWFGDSRFGIEVHHHTAYVLCRDAP